MRIEKRKGAVLGLIGGILTFVGVFLPWVTTTSGRVVLADGTETEIISSHSGFQFLPLRSIDQYGDTINFIPIMAYSLIAFGLLGLICAMVPKKVTAILALLFGLLAVVFVAAVFIRLTPLTVVPGISVGVGLYLSLVGGILLIVGGRLAFKEARKAAGAPPTVAPVSPPPPA